MEATTTRVPFSLGMFEVLLVGAAMVFLFFLFTQGGRTMLSVLFCGLLLLLGGAMLMTMSFLSRGDRSEGRPQRGLVMESLGQPFVPHPSEIVLRRRPTELFGIQARGRSFVYVIDCAPSMDRGGRVTPLEAAKRQVKNSLASLNENNQFQIVFYDRFAESLRLRGGDGLILAHPRNTEIACKWIDRRLPKNTTIARLAHRHQFALTAALRMAPEVVYFITDGQHPTFPSKGFHHLRGQNRSGALIHVIQLSDQQRSRATGTLATLAHEFGGRHTRVGSEELLAYNQPAATEPVEPAPSAVATKEQPGDEKRIPVAAGDNPNAAQAENAKEAPPWIGEAPRRQRGGKYGMYSVVAASDFQADEKLALEKLNQAMLAKARDYVDTLFEEGAGERVVELDYLLEHVVKKHYTETKTFDAPVGEMIQMHARLEFDDDDALHFKKRWKEAVVLRRLWGVTGAGALLLLVMGTVFGYLKLDTATRGYYTGRLKLAATAVILAAAGAAVVLGREYEVFGTK